MEEPADKKDIVLEVKLKTLTPFWTGGYTGNSDILKETSLIGSLRWWYRSLLQISPCFSSGKINQDSNLEKIEETLFGSTESSRSFRLVVNGAETIDLFFKSSPTVYQSNSHWLYSIFGVEKHLGYKEKKGIITNYHFGKMKAIYNDSYKPNDFNLITLKLIALKNHDITLEKLAYLIYFATTYGALGAKTQYGFGCGKWIDPRIELIRKGQKHFCPDANWVTNSDRFISLTFSIPTAVIEKYNKNLLPIGSREAADKYHNKFIPTAYDIRYCFEKSSNEIKGISGAIKEKLRNTIDKEALNYLIGNKNKIKSRLNVSALYFDENQNTWILKIWAFIPPYSKLKVNKYALEQIIVEQIKKMFGADCTLVHNQELAGG